MCQNAASEESHSKTPVVSYHPDCPRRPTKTRVAWTRTAVEYFLTVQNLHLSMCPCPTTPASNCFQTILVHASPEL